MTRDMGSIVKKWLIVIIVFALAVRVAFVLLHDPIPPPSGINLDDVDFNQLGYMFSTGQGLTDKHGDPTTTRFPLYPVFLGIIYALFGYHPFVVFIIQALIGALTPLIVFHIAGRYFNSKVSLIAAAITALYPSYIAYSGRLMSENIFLPLLALLILSVLVLRRDYSPKNLVVTGVLLGLLLLTRGVMIIMVFVIPLWIIISSGGNFLWRIKRSLIIAVAILVTLSPWIVRNYIHFQKFFITSSSGGLVLWLSMNWVPPGNYFEIERAYAYVDSVGRDEADLREFHRILVEDNMFGIKDVRKNLVDYFPDEVFPENEVEFNRYMIDKVKQEIVSHPSAYMIKTVKEFLRFWHFLDDRGRYVFSYGTILPFFLLGLWFIRKRLWEFGLLLGFFFYTWGLETIFMSAARFRMPFEIVMIVIGAYGVATIFRKARSPVLPAVFVAFILGLNLFFNYNTMVLRTAIRGVASSAGIPVSDIDEEWIPRLDDRDSISVPPN